MKCPHCQDADLVMSDRQGVEIDYCPRCRGVWLDRGELDKIIARATEYESQYRRHDDDDDDDDDDRRKYQRQQHYQSPPPPPAYGGYPPPPPPQQHYPYQKKRKSFWSELFD